MEDHKSTIAQMEIEAEKAEKAEKALLMAILENLDKLSNNFVKELNALRKNIKDYRKNGQEG